MKFMKSGKLIVAVICLLSAFKIYGHVNMPEGSMNFTIPIYNYNDNFSKLSLKTELFYSSGNGLKVDQVSNFIGTGWDLTGVPVVSRVINGLPDDQIEKPGSVFDTTKYPAGYLYNNKDINLGCPTALIKYPIFENGGVWYEDDNITKGDRELDNFQFVLNGRTGTFVIDKNFNAVQLDDSRVKIEIITGDQSPSYIRTSIKEFRITDEGGVQYIFSEQETGKLYKVNEYNNGLWSPNQIFSKSYEIPLNQNPYVTTSWFVSKIVDTKTNRFISFTYNTTNYKYEKRTGIQSQICIPGPYTVCNSPVPITITDLFNQTYTLTLGNIKGVIAKTDIQKKEISIVKFPDEFQLCFNYLTDRKDLKNTKALNSIILKDQLQNVLFNYHLTQSYFIKNETRLPNTVDEEKWSRLCLTIIQKAGSDGTFTERPWKFDYYTGTNATENFVPPYFFHAKDPWGYFNGNYSGVPTTNFLDDMDRVTWGKVCIYNQGHGYGGGVDMYYNSKNGYAKNGLLKKITNPYGGFTEYQYDQNYFNADNDYEIQSFDRNLNNDVTVGGVHISKIIEKNVDNSSDDKITDFEYTDDQDRSSLWGIEPLKFQLAQSSFWQAADKYFTGSVCKYHYTLPGKVYSISDLNHEFRIFVGLLMKGMSLIKFVNTMPNAIAKYKYFKFTTAEILKDISPFIINLVSSYVTSIIISCLTEPPSKIEGHTITFNNYINGNLLPELYKKVTQKTYSSNNLQVGKVIYDFTSPDEFPLILPNSTASFDNKPRSYSWMYGLPKAVKYYDNTPRLIKSVENEYNLKKVDVQDLKTKSCNCESFYQSSLRSDQWNTASTFNEFTNTNLYTNIFSNGLSLKVDFHNLIKGHSELKRTTEKLYNAQDVPMVSVTDYNYNHVNNLLSSQVSTNSKGAKIEQKNYYIEDYNLNNPANTVLNQMRNDNIFNVPISSEIWQTKPGQQPELLSTSVTEFGIAPNGDYKPVKTYSLQTDGPVPQNTIGVFDPDKLVRNPPSPTQPLIVPITETIYGSFGEPIINNDLQGGRVNSQIYSTLNKISVASVTNASAYDVAYTSFEINDASTNYDSWNWLSNSGTILDNGSPTGNHCSSGTILTDIISYKNKPYKLTFWAKSNNFQLTPGVLLTKTASSPTINGWTYYEYDVNPTNDYYIIYLSGNGTSIDEVRLYPKNASMSTVTYKPGIGKTSECDINNRINYYEYDELGRLSKVLDERRNIIKTYEYHFKN